MPHVLTRARSVVGGGIVAVLLLACLSAPVGAQEPAPPIPDFALAITHDELGVRVFRDGDLVVTSTLAAEDSTLLPASVTGGAALLNSSPSCRSHSVHASKFSGKIWLKTKTVFCWQYGAILGTPSLSRSAGSKAPYYTHDKTVDHSGGGDGYSWHSDIGKGRYKHCDGSCDDVYHVIFISKRNEAGGNTDSFSWYTTEAR